MITRRVSVLLALVASILAIGASAAYASLADEVNAGKAIAARVDAGAATCQNLSTSDFEHLGESVMERMVGTSSAHEAMNARMDAIMGAENADRMHEALGRRYAGCSTTGSGGGYGMMGGGGMMGGRGMMGGSAGGWGAMMGSDYSWMRGSAWQHMTRADWQRAGASMMGSGWMHSSRSGLSTGAVIGIVLGALLLGGLATYAVLRRPWRHGPSQPSPA